MQLMGRSEDFDIFRVGNQDLIFLGTESTPAPHPLAETGTRRIGDEKPEWVVDDDEGYPITTPSKPPRNYMFGDFFLEIEETGERYKVVGGCYVRGIMRDEVLDGLDEEKLEDVVICRGFVEDLSRICRGFGLVWMAGGVLGRSLGCGELVKTFRMYGDKGEMTEMNIVELCRY